MDDSCSSSPLSVLSSPLSSVASRSPSLPVDYPSPPSSNVSEIGALRRSQDVDGPPPAKRQKILKPKELNTEYLDLSALDESPDVQDYKSEERKLNRLLEVLRSKRKIVVIAGAGISVSAGSMYSLSSSPLNILTDMKSLTFDLQPVSSNLYAKNTS